MLTGQQPAVRQVRTPGEGQKQTQTQEASGQPRARTRRPRHHHSHWSKMTCSWFLLSCSSFRVFCNFLSCSNSLLWSLLISAFSSPV